MNTLPTYVEHKRRSLSQNEWKRLKPVIGELYIKKRWNYKRIAEHLRENCNFDPTHVTDSVL